MNIICPKCAAGDIGRCELHIKKDHAAAVADAIREAAGLFPVREGITCAECGSGNNIEVLNDHNMVYTYRCDDCGHEGEAVYTEVMTEIT